MVSFLIYPSSKPKEGETGTCVSGQMTRAFISTDTATGLQILSGSWAQINGVKVSEGSLWGLGIYHFPPNHSLYIAEDVVVC